MNRTPYFIFLILLLIMTFVFQSNVLGEDNSTVFSQSTVDLSAFLKMFLGLVGIIVLIFFVAWLSRKMKLVQHFTSGYQIKNLASLSLSAREKICLIEVGGKQLLIGVAPGNINQLHIFENKIEVNSSADSASHKGLFSGHLKKALNTTNQKGEGQ